MPKGLIEEIVYVEKKEKNGQTFYRFTLTVDQDEIVGIGASVDEFKIGDEVKYYFHDKWHTGKVVQTKRILK